MEEIDRRSMPGFGVVASTLVFPVLAAAQTPAGKELAPGVRQVDFGERESMIPAYKKVRMRDIVIAAGAKTPEREMMNDMLCHMTEGELVVVQNKKEFTVKKGDVPSNSRRREMTGPAAVALQEHSMSDLTDAIRVEVAPPFDARVMRLR